MQSVLVLGGTNFIGRVLVEKLKDNPGFKLTLFNRGKRNPSLFLELPQLYGDRETQDINLITKHSWDYIIDLSGYYPLTFERLLAGLKGKVGRYIFVSTISVYDIGKAIGREINENEPTLLCTKEQLTSGLPDAYGEKKAEMERLLLSCDWLDKVILRPSLVYGQYDFTDRFYYWLWRAKFSDKVVLPGNGNDITSVTFVDDLADLLMRSLQLSTHHTVYNAATHVVSINQLVETCAKQMNRQPKFISTEPEKLIESGIQPWADMALWMNGDLIVSTEKVKKDFDVLFTPFEETVARTAKYYNDLGWPQCKYGMSADVELKLLQR